MLRVKVLILTVGAVAIASLATACGSNSATGTTTTATTTAPASTPAATASASPVGEKAAAADCLQTHGVSQGALSAVLGGIGMTASAAPTATSTVHNAMSACLSEQGITR